MTAEEYMGQIEKLNLIIRNKEIEKAQWQAMASGSTSAYDGDRVQSSGSQQRMENAVCQYVSIEAEIERYKEKLINKKKQIIETIEELETMEYQILHLVYIQEKSFHEVSEQLKMSYSWVTWKHREALKDLQRILDRSGYGKKK